MSDTSPASEGAFLPQGSQVKTERGSVPEEPAVAEAAPVVLKRAPSPSGGSVVTILIAVAASVFLSGIVAAVISVGIAFWMAGPPRGRDDRLMQEGKVNVGQNAVREVFYPEPFAGPPNLELDGPMVFITLKEQKADHFTIQSQINGEVRWRAEGLRERRPPPGK